MNTLIRRFLVAYVNLALAVSISLPISAAPPTDWSAVPVKILTLFYPGQGGYQWLRCAVKNRRPDEAGLI